MKTEGGFQCQELLGLFKVQVQGWALSLLKRNSREHLGSVKTLAPITSLLTSPRSESTSGLTA